MDDILVAIILNVIGSVQSTRQLYVCHLYHQYKYHYRHLFKVCSPHDDWWAPVLRPKTSKTLFGSVIFFYNVYKNKFKNLIQTSNCKFEFRGLRVLNICNIHYKVLIGHFSNHNNKTQAWEVCFIVSTGLYF